MSALIEDFENLKVSAFSKSQYINSLNLSCVEPSVDENDCARAKNVSKRSPGKFKNNRNNDHFSNYMFKKNVADFESKRNDMIEERLQARLNRFKNFEQQQERQLKEQWLTQQRKLIEDMQKQEDMIYETIEQHNRETSSEHQKLDRYYQELAEKQQKQIQELQMKEQRRRHLITLLDKIKKNHVEFLEVYTEIANLIKTFNTNELQQISKADVVEKLRSLLSAMQEILYNCKKGKVTEEDAKKSDELVTVLKAVKNRMQDTVNNLILNEQKSSTAYSEPQQEIKEPVIVEPQQAKNEAPASVNEQNTKPSGSVIFDSKKFVSKNNFKMYSELRRFQETFQASYKDILADPNMKKYRQDCMKAINIPVNAISDSNSQHLLDKYNRLKSLLAGKTVSVGDNQINASQHPQGLLYCTNLLAVKFVKQGEYLVTNNPNAAFCYAAIIIALWNDFPDFGKLVLAQFYKQCPYLVPFYIPQDADQSDKEYYTSRGYLYDDKGVIEKQDKFLKRMTGIVRLYSAIVISKPKRSQGKPNPHGLPHAWRLITSLLNLEPQYDITATVLHEFLDVAGSTIQSAYGKMFVKLMRYLVVVYIPMLNKIDTGGPASRLNVLLEEFMQDGRFKPPSGMLPGNFW